MFDEIVSWAVTSLRTDVPAVSNRVVAAGGYQNTTLPRISVELPVGMSETASFIGNKQGLSAGTDEGGVMTVTLPIRIFSKTSKQMHSLVDDVLKSFLITRRHSSTSVNIHDVMPAGINYLTEKDDDGKPQVWQAVIDFEIMYDYVVTV